jgi:hypothetical protein
VAVEQMGEVMKDETNADQTSLARIEEDIDAELAEVEVSSDPAGADEPIRDVYEVRLQALRAAVAGVRNAEDAEHHGDVF